MNVELDKKVFAVSLNSAIKSKAVWSNQTKSTVCGFTIGYYDYEGTALDESCASFKQEIKKSVF